MKPKLSYSIENQESIYEDACNSLREQHTTEKEIREASTRLRQNNTPNPAALVSYSDAQKKEAEAGKEQDKANKKWEQYTTKWKLNSRRVRKLNKAARKLRVASWEQWKKYREKRAAYKATKETYNETSGRYGNAQKLKTKYRKLRKQYKSARDQSAKLRKEAYDKYEKLHKLRAESRKLRNEASQHEKKSKEARRQAQLLYREARDLEEKPQKDLETKLAVTRWGTWDNIKKKQAATEKLFLDIRGKLIKKTTENERVKLLNQLKINVRIQQKLILLYKSTFLSTTSIKLSFDYLTSSYNSDLKYLRVSNSTKAYRKFKRARESFLRPDFQIEIASVFMIRARQLELTTLPKDQLPLEHINNPRLNAMKPLAADMVQMAHLAQHNQACLEQIFNSTSEYARLKKDYSSLLMGLWSEAIGLETDANAINSYAGGILLTVIDAMEAAELGELLIPDSKDFNSAQEWTAYLSALLESLDFILQGQSLTTGQKKFFLRLIALTNKKPEELAHSQELMRHDTKSNVDIFVKPKYRLPLKTILLSNNWALLGDLIQNRNAQENRKLITDFVTAIKTIRHNPKIYNWQSIIENFKINRASKVSALFALIKADTECRASLLIWGQILSQTTLKQNELLELITIIEAHITNTDATPKAKIRFENLLNIIIELHPGLFAKNPGIEQSLEPRSTGSVNGENNNLKVVVASESAEPEAEPLLSDEQPNDLLRRLRQKISRQQQLAKYHKEAALKWYERIPVIGGFALLFKTQPKKPTTEELFTMLEASSYDIKIVTDILNTDLKKELFSIISDGMKKAPNRIEHTDVENMGRLLPLLKNNPLVKIFINNDSWFLNQIEAFLTYILECHKQGKQILSHELKTLDTILDLREDLAPLKNLEQVAEIRAQFSTQMEETGFAEELAALQELQQEADAFAAEDYHSMGKFRTTFKNIEKDAAKLKNGTPASFFELKHRPGPGGQQNYTKFFEHEVAQKIHKTNLPGVNYNVEI